MTGRLRLLLVSEPMEYGVLSYLERLLDGLDRTRWEPALACSPHRMAPQARRLVGRLRAEGVRVRHLPFRRRIGVGDATTVLHLLAELREFRPDVVHLHSSKAGVIGRAIARRLGIGVLYTPHGTSWQYTGWATGRVQLALERALRRATDVLVAVCPEEARAFVDHVGFPPARVRVVRNGVPVPDADTVASIRERARAALGIGRDDVWAAFVGRLTCEKGLDVLLRALGRDTGVQGLLVVGDGAERPALEEAAARCELPVRFCGYREDVSPFLAAADVFVQPSRSEGLPFSLLEAMAHGVPVVGSDVGGVKAALEGCGRVVPPGDPDALTAALADLARDRALRRTLGEAGRRRIARDFGVAAMLDALHETYEGACRAVGRAA